MKNEIKEDIKIYKKTEFKKSIKRIFAVLCYGAAVFNAAVPEQFWSLPLIVLLYAVYSTLKCILDKEFCISELAMSIVFKTFIVYVVTAWVFNLGVDYIQYFCLIIWVIQGVLYHVTLEKKTNLKKLFVFLLSTILFDVTLGAAMLMGWVTFAPVMVVLVVFSMAVFIFYAVSARDELMFFLRKYFHSGINIKDEY